MQEKSFRNFRLSGFLLPPLNIMSTKFTRLGFLTTGNVAIPFFAIPQKNR